ncbi:hypothetical protein [Variovorax gossypii]
MAADLARLLREAPQIEELYASANHLGDAGAIELAQALRENSTLQTLELASNGIGSQGASALFEAARVSSLLSLNLGHAASAKALGAPANQMGDEGAACAARLIGASPVLRKLDLMRNGITECGQSVLMEAALHSRWLGRLIVEGSQPEALVQHLALNRAAHGGDVPTDRALIKSVYR